MFESYVFWWEIPCKGIIGVFKAFIENYSPESIVITGSLSKERKEMGWNDIDRPLFRQHIIVNFNQWDGISELIDSHKNSLHVVCGVSSPNSMNKLRSKLLRQSISYAIMTEAPCNMFTGYKKLLKSIYEYTVLPFKNWRFASNAKVGLCLSGSKKNDLKKMRLFGFRKEAIKPFGYWTDSEYLPFRPIDKEHCIQIVCPGLLEKYKGVEILVKALSKLNCKGLKNYICHITGSGSQKNYIRSLIKKYSLEKNVIMHGVLPETEMQKLLNDIDILVVPGLREPWGIRVNEAIQRGNAIVCSDGVGASDLVEKCHCGFVFRSGNIGQISKCLSNYLLDYTLLNKHKEEAVIHREELSCVAQAKILLNYLESI